MKKLLLLFLVLMFISCSFIKEGYIVKKIKTEKSVKYIKEEITRQVPYSTFEYNSSTKVYETRIHYRTEYTGEYEYFKEVNYPDYIIIIEKINKRDDKKRRKIYIDEIPFNNLEIGYYLHLDEINYHNFDLNNKTIEISKNEYLEGMK